MNRVAARLRAVAFGLFCGLISTAALAMGTPPQTVAKPVEAGRSAVMLKADDLRAAPELKSTVLRRIEKGAQVRLLTSQGGWSQISSGGKSGWVRILSVSSPATESVDFSDLGVLGKTPQGKVVAVAGTRGLDESKLRLASYDAAEIELLHTFAISRAAAEQFGQVAGLQIRAMPYIDAPKR
jgi:hypothetical protein